MNIAIHGIGQTTPDYYLTWGLSSVLNVPSSEVQGFYYDDVLDKDQMDVWETWLHGVLSKWYSPRLKAIVPDPMDYLDDILVFFLCPDARDMIEYKLNSMLRGPKRIRLFAYSLGSMVAYWYLLRYPEIAKKVELVTIASPMGSPVLAGLVRYWMGRVCEEPMERPAVVSWKNLYSTADPLSGVLYSYGVETTDEIMIPFQSKVLHTDVAGYLAAYGKSLPVALRSPVVKR